MNDVVLVFQHAKTGCRSIGDLAQNSFGNTVTVYLVYRSTVHEFHANIDRTFLKESAVEVNDKGRYALVQDIELHDNGSELGVVQFKSNLLHSHYDTCRTTGLSGFGFLPVGRLLGGW